MRINRTVILLFVLGLAFSPVLSACSPRAQGPVQSQAMPSQPAAAATAPATAGAIAPPRATAVPSPTPQPTPTRAPLPPVVTDIKPARGEEQAVTAPVVITFDQPMDPSSTSRAFSIEPKVAGEVRVQGNQLVFAPSESLERAADYRILLAETAASRAGLKMRSPISYHFRTVGFLEVTGTQPAHGAAGVAADSSIIVSFNRPVVPLAGPATGITMPEPLVITPTVKGAGEWLNTAIYRFTPEKGLVASTTYTVVVKAGLEDTTGGVLSRDYSFSFRTVDPTVLSWQPENRQNVRIESPITVTFSMAMDRPSTEAAFSLADETGERIPGFFTWAKDDTVLGFKPARSLAFGTTYRASVATTARPANGQGELRDSADRQVAFQTVSLPKIRLTDPREGSTRADPSGGVRIEFVSPMDPTSFVTGTVQVVPKPARLSFSYDEWGNALYVSFEKAPSTSYVVTLSGRVADPYGNTLGRDFVLRFKTRDYDPILYLNTPGLVGTYNAYTQTKAAVTYRNVGAIDFKLHRVTPEDFLRLTTKDYWEAWNAYRPSASDLVHEWRIETTARRNQVAVLHSELVDAEGQPLQPGMYFLQVSSPGLTSPDRTANRQLFVRADLNVTLKSAPQEAFAWVTDLKSGRPVAGASVRFTDNGAINLTATTDSDGVARVTLPTTRYTWEPLLAIAGGDGGSFGVASSNWRDGISPWDFGVPGGVSAEPYAAYVYTDRPIYRPGQTVYWKALVRRDDDARYSLPAPGQPVTVTIRDDQGNELLEQRMTLSPTGTVHGKMALGLDAGLGYYYLSVQVTKQNSYGVGFQVAEYRKPEYEITAQTDRPEYKQGEQINVSVQANYFFGGPVKNAQARWALVSSDHFFAYQGDDGYYSFSDWDWYEARRETYGGLLGQGTGTTDAEGRFTFSVPADITRFTASQRFTFDITITDINNQAVSTQVSAVVHKGDFYIGLLPEGYVARVGEANRVRVITVDPQSRPVPNTAVNLVVNRVEWLGVKEQAEDGRFYWTTRARKTPVFTDTLTTDVNGKAYLTWTPKTGGEYKIEATARDSARRVLRSAAYVWASGAEYVTWRQENNDRIELVADRDEYKPGDTARLLVASPYQGTVKALVTIERNHILDYQVIDLRGNSQTLEIPITPDHVPNIYVSVVLIKGMDESSPSPSFKMGFRQLKVSVADRQLQVIVTPDRSRVGPRERVGWLIETRDAAGKPVQAEVSLALVDKAIYSLATDSAGTLMDRFYSQRSPGVETACTLVVNVDRIVAQLPEGGKGGGGGGDGMAGALMVRQAFPDVAYWNATVTTDARGLATVEFTLPDNLTTWTMDARAITADTLVGQSKTDIVATKDLLVRPVLPRFFIRGDRAEIAAVIHNTTGRELDVSFGLTATGLDVAGAQQGEVTIAAGGTYKAVWPVTARSDVDEAKVMMRAVAGSLGDAVEMTLPVYGYTTPEVVGTSGQLAGDETRLELVRLPGNADPTRGGLEITLEPSLAAGMRGALTYLEHYPYECIEQTTSRFVPNVVSAMALKSLGVERPELEGELAQQVAVGLQRIYAQQHVDGGWGWWHKDLSHPSITAYVVFGLAKAKQAGFAVDQSVLDRGISFLERSLKAPSGLKTWELNQQAFSLYALAEAGRVLPNRAGALYEQREKLSLYAKAYLAMTLGLVNDDASANRIKTLLADLTSRAAVSATSAHWEEGWTDYWNMNTDTRTTSIVLDAIARLDPGHSLAPNAVRWLMSARKADHWETTQENAWATIALTDWMLASGELEGNYDWSVTLNDRSLGSGTVTPATVEQTVALRADITQLLLDQTNALLIERMTTGGQTGKGQLYYTAHLKTYLPVEELRPLSRGLSISREYRLADCGLPTDRDRVGSAQCPLITQARVGDVIDVTLTIVVPDALHFVVVEDPLPAGAEAIDTSLRTTSITAEGPRLERETGAKEGWSWWWTPTHTELRDEKVALFASVLESGTYEFKYQIRASLPGRFLTLPATGYQMYFPEVWGRGSGSVFTITE